MQQSMYRAAASKMDRSDEMGRSWIGTAARESVHNYIQDPTERITEKST
jgi:hypothetical protein